MVEPLDLIGRSQTEPNVELRKLASGLAQILEQNRGRSDVAGIQAGASRDVGALGQGFPGFSSIVPSEMAAKRAAGLNLTRAQTLPPMAKTGLYTIPPPGADVTGALDPSNIVKQALPSGALGQYLAGGLAAKTTQEEGKQTKYRDILVPDPDRPGKQKRYDPVVDVRDVTETKKKTDTQTTKGRRGGSLGRFGQPIAAPTPSAAADTGVDVFTATPAELAAQNLVRAKLKYDKGPYKKGDTVVYRQLGDQIGPVVAHRKGEL